MDMTGSVEVPMTGSVEVPMTGSVEVPMTGSVEVPMTGSVEMLFFSVYVDVVHELTVIPVSKRISMKVHILLMTFISLCIF
jgi:hypothetical protein